MKAGYGLLPKGFEVDQLWGKEEKKEDQDQESTHPP
jgi:hypothetical protein